jgi:hypothetical protein
MESSNVHPQESLQLIHQMIRDKRKQMGKSAIHYIIWGSSVSLAAIMHFILLKKSINHAELVWPIMMPLTGFIAIYFGYKQHKKQAFQSWIDKASDALWLGFTISMLIVIFAGSITGNWSLAYTFLLCLYGLGLYVSGSLISFKAFKIGGIINWLLAVVSLKLDFPELLLVIAIAMVTGYLIPGILLYREERKNEV